MKPRSIVSREEWLEARRAHLASEKELTRQRDALAAERRGLPWVRLDRTYPFEGPGGPTTLADLFAGRSQLVVYHFMLGPGWEEGCKSCSFWADNYQGAVVHLAARDVTLAAVSRAPFAEIEAFRRRMGWSFPWVSSHGSDFNYDFGVSFTPEQREGEQPNYNFGTLHFAGEEAPGLSVFARGDDGAVYHTYSTYARGLDVFNGTYQLLDLVPKGRDEEGLDYSMAWVRHHDRYGR
jgi:predicted dithiol-disulfide oxidoreductase (DUF899 family)